MANETISIEDLTTNLDEFFLIVNGFIVMCKY